MSGSDRQTIFWIRYARLRRKSSSITDWPGYRRMLMDQARWLIAHNYDSAGAIKAALDRLASGEDLRYSERSNPRA